MLRKLTQIEDNYNPFLEDTYKVYNDGGHYIAQRPCPCYRKSDRFDKPKEAIDILFDNLYELSLCDGLCGLQQFEYIKQGLFAEFPFYPDLDRYISVNIFRVKKNLYLRKRRFKRKAYLNEWNYFVTFTYNDKIHTEQSFYKKLRKCLNNLHTRRGWLYMGVFERSPDNNRLHFHGLLYVPYGEMIGELTEIKDFNFKNKKMQVSHSNSFFDKKFGRCDFSAISPVDLKQGNTLNYLLKYISKGDCKVVYSRGVPAEVVIVVASKNIVCHFEKNLNKFVIFDGVINWFRDILGKEEIVEYDENIKGRFGYLSYHS